MTARRRGRRRGRLPGFESHGLLRSPRRHGFLPDGEEGDVYRGCIGDIICDFPAVVVVAGGEKSEDAAPARASRPRMPSCLLHHSESLRCAPSLSGDPPAVTRVVSGVNGDDGDDWENDATCPSSRDGPAESYRFSDCRDIVICPNPRHDGRPATILTAPSMPSEGGVTMVEWAV